MALDSRLTLFDRVAISWLSSLFGLATAVLVWVAVVLITGTSSIGAAPFVFSAGAFAIAGFVLGPTFAQAIGVWLQGFYVIFNAFGYNWGAELGCRPFRPLWATAFILVVVSVTIALAMA